MTIVQGPSGQTPFVATTVMGDALRVTGARLLEFYPIALGVELLGAALALFIASAGPPGAETASLLARVFLFFFAGFLIVMRAEALLEERSFSYQNAMGFLLRASPFWNFVACVSFAVLPIAVIPSLEALLPEDSDVLSSLALIVTLALPLILYLSVRLFLAVPASWIEGLSPLAAFAYSWRLTRSRFIACLFIGILTSFAFLALATVVALFVPFLYVSMAGGSPAGLFIFGPFSTIFLHVLGLVMFLRLTERLSAIDLLRKTRSLPPAQM
ncbi:MAG: hypothetical protein AAGB03_04840 [Pseudomonadota bacterium]